MSWVRNKLFGWPPVVTVLAVSVTVGGASGQEADQRSAEADPEAEASASGSEDERPSWEFDVSGHGGLAGLAFRGEISFGSRFREETVGYRRSMNFGAGIRAMRGRWGVEARYDRLGSGAFTPAAQVRETRFAGVQDLAIPEVSSNAFGILAVAEFPRPDSRAGLFVGAGYGYLSLGGDSDRLADGGLPPWISMARVNGQDVDFEVAGNELRADGGVPGILVSAGVSLRFGRFVLRPRLDGFVGGLGGGRQVKENWGASFVVPGTDTRAVVADFAAVTTSVRPRFLLFNVEVGWSSADRQSAGPDLWPSRSAEGGLRR